MEARVTQLSRAVPWMKPKADGASSCCAGGGSWRPEAGHVLLRVRGRVHRQGRRCSQQTPSRLLRPASYVEPEHLNEDLQGKASLMVVPRPLG